MIKSLITLGLVLGAPSLVAAPLGTAFTYQGELRQGGGAASGLYDFQFCIFDDPVAASGSLCSSTFDDVPVERGLFTLDLDFGATVFAGQQRFLEIRVRDGAASGGFAILAPRQPVRAAPEAMHAAASPWSGLAGVPGGFADGVDDRGITQIVAGAGLGGGTITTTGTLSIASGGVVQGMIATGAVGDAQLADAAVGAAKLAAGAVGTDALANGAVTRPKLAAQAVGTPQLGDDAVDASKLANASVDTAAIVDGNVTRPKLAAAAVGATQVDASEVQLRISGSCPAGSYLRAIQANGAVVCEALSSIVPQRITRTLDTLAIVGTTVSWGARYTSLALTSDNRPVVAYFDTAGLDLKIYVCADENCTTGTMRTLDATGDVGRFPSIIMRPGNKALIAYQDVTAGDLKVYDCFDDGCTSGVARTLDTAGNVGGYVVMAARADGRGVIAHYDFSGTDLKLFLCADLACSTGTINVQGSPGDVGLAPSITVRANGNPAFGLYTRATGRTIVIGCVDPTCSSTAGNDVRPSPSGGDPTYTAIIGRADNRPLLAVYDAGNKDLMLFDCAAVNCETGSSAARILDGTGDVGESPSIAMGPDNKPLITYYDRTNTALKLFRCANANCTSGGATVLDDLGDVGLYTSLAVRSDGRPVVSYWDATNGAVKLHICANTECR